MPALILSASVTLEARQRAASAGADEFLGKPFDAAELIQQIDRLGAQTSRGRMTTSSANQPQPIKPNLTVVSSRPKFPNHSDIDSDFSSERDFQSDLVDRSRLSQLEDIARDSSFLGELIAGFVRDVDEILEKTDHAVLSENKRAIPDLMHSLKGAAVGVGAIKLAALASELDQSYEQSKIRDIASRVAEIKDCFASTSVFLRQYLQLHLH